MDYQYTGLQADIFCLGEDMQKQDTIQIFFHYSLYFNQKSSSKVQNISLIKAKYNGNHTIQPVVNKIEINNKNNGCKYLQYIIYNIHSQLLT